MPRMIGDGLSRREREILDVLHRLERATVGEVQAGMPNAPSYSAVRTLLRILEEKGHIRHIEDGRRFVYLPTEARKSAAGAALRQVIATFFGGSLDQAVTAFLMDDSTSMSDEELDRLSEAVERARIQEADLP
jgi:predicted transcriptional regulator